MKDDTEEVRGYGGSVRDYVGNKVYRRSESK